MLQPWTRVALPLQKASRSWRFSIFPVPVFGSGPSTNCTTRGILYFAMRGLSESQQLFFVQLLTGFQDNDGDRNLAPLRIGG